MTRQNFLYKLILLAMLVLSVVATLGCNPVSAAESNSGRPDEILVGIGASSSSTSSSNASSSSAPSGNEPLDNTDSFSGVGVLGVGVEEKMTEKSNTSTSPGAGTATAQDAADDWKLILVNATHPIPEDYKIPELQQLQNGNSVDSRIYPALQQMFDDARSQGIYPYVTSSYRSTEKQQQLMDEKIAEYQAAGYSDEEAKALAEEWVAIPGTSEHQLGLSVDISSDPASGQDAGSVWYWLQLYCWDYGFIIRYPEDKKDITGIINEPWHYRYVGVENAQAMKESGQCLEEYLGAI